MKKHQFWSDVNLICWPFIFTFFFQVPVVELQEQFFYTAVLRSLMEVNKQTSTRLYKGLTESLVGVGRFFLP